ncbi:MAG: hypothetical protein NTW78_09425 [Campylobacterales bacterium]|nr:hypothetical protein [Campylobacterales bacterium]
MFDFLDSDWFNISLQIIFLILISYDIKKYRETKKKEYITNIIFTLGFAVWTLQPYYNSYFEWGDGQKLKVISTSQHDTNQTVNTCIDEKIFKEYSFESYQNLDKNSTDFAEFIKEAKKDCTNVPWF